MKRSSKLITMLAAFALLISGFFGVAASASPEPAAPPSAVAKVGEQTAQASLDKSRAGVQGTISYRHQWCGIQGFYNLNLTGLGAYNGQAVAVTISESGDGGSEFIGSAVMTVHNVSVWNGNVTVKVNVQWGSPLCVWTHYVAI
ncbi:hypothetical protein SAMN05421504_11534 [Amycolatopsis xylanica]|uniref:Uncharacterized protein n=1 Tax=Amycolatopsis xylanica TaxID=589385 RepID=A0A1H3SQW5_9PSEU|nr:hypothetical protein [Amycolatopsis xylanica]SDZ40344.1 hypothetical protein SAMN05421504_11534 [Amycolatopsis xylanica]